MSGELGNQANDPYGDEAFIAEVAAVTANILEVDKIEPPFAIEGDYRRTIENVATLAAVTIAHEQGKSHTYFRSLRKVGRKVAELLDEANDQA